MAPKIVKPITAPVIAPVMPVVQVVPDSPRPKPKPQPWTIPDGTSATAPVTATVTPATAVSPLAKPKIKLAPATVDVYLEVQSRPQQGGLGAVFALNTREKDGVRAVCVALFRDRPGGRAGIGATICRYCGFLAFLFFVEWLLRTSIQMGAPTGSK